MGIRWRVRSAVRSDIEGGGGSTCHKERRSSIWLNQRGPYVYLRVWISSCHIHTSAACCCTAANLCYYIGRWLNRVEKNYVNLDVFPWEREREAHDGVAKLRLWRTIPPSSHFHVLMNRLEGRCFCLHKWIHWSYGKHCCCRRRSK